MSALDATLHTHTTQPSLAAPWCGACSAMVDFAIVLNDHLHAKE